MKKLIIAIVFLVLTSGLLFAGGGQNTLQKRGENGKGTISTEKTTQGEQSRDRTGQ